ncbi:hypothetical protein [Xenorhabdus doucetiae]|nr:hypothetical protein [Xenorhabdus sp. 3]
MNTSWKLSVPEDSDLIAGQIFELAVIVPLGAEVTMKLIHNI